jgi:hypothetical protein
MRRIKPSWTKVWFKALFDAINTLLDTPMVPVLVKGLYRQCNVKFKDDRLEQLSVLKNGC